MTLQEIEELLDDTRRTSRAGDRVTYAMALGVLEIARQLAILNEGRTPNSGAKAKGKASKKK
jgi:hypothetical protein